MCMLDSWSGHIRWSDHVWWNGHMHGGVTYASLDQL